MKTPGRCVAALIVLTGAATAASAQDWLVTPAPAIPLHIPISPARPSATPPPVILAPAPTRTPLSVDEIRRLIDPYHLTGRPTPLRRPLEVQPVSLPSMQLVPFAMTGSAGSPPNRLYAVPVVAFPNIPITWLLGF